MRRNDLTCEMLIWQWTQLGDGNPKEFGDRGCKYIKKRGQRLSVGQKRKNLSWKKAGKLPSSIDMEIGKDTGKHVEL